jgi:hypothetical protein
VFNNVFLFHFYFSLFVVIESQLILGKILLFQEVALKLQELLYLNNILYLVANQVGRYSGAKVDVMNYSTTVMASNEFIEPHPHYSKQIQYPQLYEELKAIILI